MTARINIVPRRTQFDFSDVPVYWNGGDPVLTRFFDALSVNFPDGERFFIQSVRNYEDRIVDPQLKKDVKSFIRQEAQHGIVHDQYNAAMAAQGVAVDLILANQIAVIGFIQKYLPKKYQLALTAAAEHLTATMGESFVGVGRDDSVFAGAHPAMQAMYMWHGVEEVEHKAVAFDVYQQAAGGGYLNRASALIFITLGVHFTVGSILWHMLKVDGLGGRPMVIARGLYRLYGPRGYLTRMVLPFLAWFRPGFHPYDSGVPEKVSRWLAEYDRHQDPAEATRVVFDEGGAQATAPTTVCAA